MDDVTLETGGPVLRRFRPEDIDTFAAMDVDAQVMRYIGDGATRTPDVALELVTRWVESPPDHGKLGFWAITTPPDAQCHGWACLKELGDSGEIEVGYRLPAASWGRGFATACARRLVQYGFDTCGLDRIVGITHPGNGASQRVLEKAGLRFERMSTFEGHPVRFYGLDRSALASGS